MRQALPPSILDAFSLSASELGMFSAARIFIEEMARTGGAELLSELRDVVGPSYPVLDVLAGRFIRERALPIMNIGALKDAVAGLSRVVVVGSEACLIDAVADELPAHVEMAVVLDATLSPTDEGRVAANFASRARLCHLDDIVHWSGVRSALVTAIYGTDGHRAIVCGSWLRLMGPDTRAWFAAFVGVNLLGPPMDTYPRWLRETLLDDFTVVIDPEPAP